MGYGYSKGFGIAGIGFIIGTIGLKALTSPAAKRIYVRVVSKGLQLKAEGQEILEEAKCNIDDIVAEANYLNELEGEPEIRNAHAEEPPEESPIQSSAKANA